MTIILIILSLIIIHLIQVVLDRNNELGKSLNREAALRIKLTSGGYHEEFITALYNDHRC